MGDLTSFATVLIDALVPSSRNLNLFSRDLSLATNTKLFLAYHSGLDLHPRPASRSAQSSSSTRIYFPPISLGGGPLTSVFDWTWQYRLFLQRPPSPKAKWFRRTTRRFSFRSGPAADSPREARRNYQQRHILGSPSFNIFSARTTSTN